MIITNEMFKLFKFENYLLNVPQPVGQIVERLQIGDVVHQQDAHRTPIVGSSQRAESLLACSVPNLQLDWYPVQVDEFLLEVDACERMKLLNIINIDRFFYI